MTNKEIRLLLDSVDLQALRQEQDITARRVALALGVTTGNVRCWEKRLTTPTGSLACRYARIVRGLLNHAEATLGWREMAA